jgi:hypothetical protein
MPVESKTGNRLLALSELELDDTQQVSLCEVLDRVLNKGVVVAGEATISVADIDLVYLGLQIVLTSMETARQRVCLAPLHLGAGMGIGKEKANALNRAGTGGV